MGKQDYSDFTAVNEKQSEEWVWVLFLSLKAELKVIRERDPAIKSNLEIVLYPGFRAVLYYRLADSIWKIGCIVLRSVVLVHPLLQRNLRHGKSS